MAPRPVVEEGLEGQHPVLGARTQGVHTDHLEVLFKCRFSLSSPGEGAPVFSRQICLVHAAGVSPWETLGIGMSRAN